MSGFSGVTGEENIMFADNASFDGTERDGAMTADGQLWIGSTTAPHVRKGTITAGTGVTVANSSGNITITAGGSVPLTFHTDGSDATPAANAVKIAGGTGITTSGSGSTVTVTLDTPVAVTNGGTGLSSAAQGDMVYGSAANTYSALAKDANATRYVSNTGASNNPAWAQVNLANGVTGTLPVTNGGTGLATATQGDMVYGSAANTYSALAKDTNATRYVSNTGTSNNPAWAQVDLTNGVTGVLPVANGGSGSSTTSIENPLAPSATINGTQVVVRGPYVSDSITNFSTLNTRIYLSQIFVDYITTYVKLGIYQVSAASSSTNVMIAIYDSTGTGGLPGSTLVELIGIVNGTTGAKHLENTISWTPSSRGWYWVAMQSSAAITCAGSQFPSRNLLIYDTASLGTAPLPIGFLSVTNTYGSFPTNPTINAASQTSAPYVYIR